MPVSIEFIPGPHTASVSRTTAERGLRNHPAIRKGAAYALDEMDGRYIAAIIHDAADAPPFGAGGPADAEEEAPGPASGGDSASDSSGSSDGPPVPDESGSNEDDPKKKKKGDESGEIAQLKQLVEQIAQALGVPVDLGESPVPGADGADVPPPGAPAGPPGMGAPGAPGDPNTQHVIHEKTMKPGDVPPGGTPVGAPAFASVRRDHPWAHIAGKVASFQVEEKIGDTPFHVVAKELDSLAGEIGYHAKYREDVDVEGNRVAVGLITRH